MSSLLETCKSRAHEVCSSDLQKMLTASDRAVIIISVQYLLGDEDDSILDDPAGLTQRSQCYAALPATILLVLCKAANIAFLRNLCKAAELSPYLV